MSIYDKASLVLIPSGTKTSKVYSQKPVSGDGDFTFSRSTAATRVNADGNIEKETQNLLLQSNSFDTSWTKNNVTTTSGQSGYDGSNDAWLLSKGAAAFTNLIQSVTTSGVNTFSVYAKSGTLTQLTLRDSATNIYARFNLSDGSLITTSGSPIATSIEDVGSGWYRCSITMSMSSASLQIYPDWNQTTAGNIYIQDAQLEQGLVARDYIETTTAAVEGGITDNVPRLDYTDSSCPALLLEPQRSNLVNFSEYIDSYWNPFGNISITDNDSTSPEGVQNATKISAAATTTAGIGIQKGISVTANQLHTISFFAKETDFRYIQLFHGSNQVTSNARTNFDIQEGVVTYEESGVVTASIEDYGNGWYRCIATMEALTSVLQAYIVVAPTGTATRSPQISATAGDSYQLYGIQMEQGSYATSYIPTYGTSVTRNKDSISLYNQDDLFGDGQGTWAIDINLESRLHYNYSILGSYPNYIGVNVSTTFMDMEIIDNAVLAGQIRYNNSSTGRFKIAIAYDGNSALFYVNGTKVGEDTSVSIPSVNDIFLRNNEANANAFRYNQALLFPTKLTEAELADLTTL